jgi:hypothetical protein
MVAKFDQWMVYRNNETRTKAKGISMCLNVDNAATAHDVRLVKNRGRTTPHQYGLPGFMMGSGVGVKQDNRNSVPGNQRFVGESGIRRLLIVTIVVIYVAIGPDVLDIAKDGIPGSLGVAEPFVAGTAHVLALKWLVSDNVDVLELNLTVR